MVVKQCMGAILPDKPTDFPGFWLSVSKIKVFKNCPAQYRFNYIERLPKKERDHHIYGKFTHEILETFHKRKLEGDLLENAKLMTECFYSASESFKEKLTSTQQQEAFDTMILYLKLLESGDKMVSAEVVSVEESFWIGVEDKILLHGFIDRSQIDDDGWFHVADYKTSKSSKFLEDDYFQLLTYAYVKCLENPGLDKIRCSYIMLRDKFKFITKEYSRKDIMKVEGVLLEHAEKMQSERLYRPNTSPLCAFCDYEEFCPEGQVAAEEYRERKRRRELFSNPSNKWGKTSW